MRIIRTILPALLLTIACASIAQSGSPFISYFETREGYEAENWSICEDMSGGVLLANKRGLIRFDGNNWSTIPMEELPLRLFHHKKSNRVYVITESSIGTVSRDKLGGYRFTQLEPVPTSELVASDSSIIFYSDSVLVKINPFTDNKPTVIESKQMRISGVLHLGGEWLVKTESSYLYEIGDSFLKQSGKRLVLEGSLIFALPHDPDHVLLGTSNDKLYLYNGRNLTPYELSIPEYLSDQVLSAGVILNDSSYAFSTLYGGVLIAAKKDGRVIHTLNFETGLPEDEIYAMSTDHLDGLWLTYSSGMCRVDPGIPVYGFQNYPGLEGLVTNVIWYNNTLYASTSEGLFYLSEVKNYEDVAVYYRQKIEPEKERGILKKRDREPDETGEKKERNRLFGRIFNRDRDQKASTTKAERNSSSEQTRVVKKMVSKLRSIDYVFKRVEGLNSRCHQLYGTAEGLLVGASSGLYAVRDQKAELVLDTRNVHYIGSPDNYGYHDVCADEGVFRVIHSGGKWVVAGSLLLVEEPVFSTQNIGPKTWLSGYDRVYLLDSSRPDSMVVQQYNFSAVYPEELFLSMVEDTLYLFSSSEIRYYDPAIDSFKLITTPGYSVNDFKSLHYFTQSDRGVWLKLDQRIVEFTGSIIPEQQGGSIWNLFENINSHYFDDNGVCWVVDDYASIYRIDKGCLYEANESFSIHIESVSNEIGERFDPDALSLDPSVKLLRIEVSAPHFLKQGSIQYHYIIEGKMEAWSKWSSSSILEFYPEPGAYVVKIRAKNILDELSDPVTIEFQVIPPFYKTTWFYLALIPLVIVLFLLVMMARERKLRRDKQLLEEKVRERTREIQKQKEKIEFQKDEILAQKDDITSSIHYASRIQEAVLPAEEIFRNTFSDHFIFYRPRDIVSGDFYWIGTLGKKTVFAVADCTGHGVPGAFMSLLGNSFLNEITKDPRRKLSAGEILDELRFKITTALSQSGDETETKDGMDIALCVYDKKEMKLEYSGAYNPLYLIRGEEFIEYKADRMPIGYYPREAKFRTQQIALKPGDAIYLFSDGFPDQFGGNQSKKFTTKRLKSVIAEQAANEMKFQMAYLETSLKHWMVDAEQLDDILMIGVRV